MLQCILLLGFSDVNRISCGWWQNVLKKNILCVATNIDQTVEEAARGDHIEIVRLCYEGYGATDVNWAMLCAAVHGHLHIVQLCLEEYRADNVDEAFREATKYHRTNVLQYLHGQYKRK